MSVLQARGEGLCPINTDAGSESFIAWLRREGYTSIRRVATNKPKKVKSRVDTKPPARRAPRRVTRRPRL